MSIKFEGDEDIFLKLKEIVETLGMDHVALERVHAFRSRGSGARRTIARCYGLSKIWQRALGTKAHYVIEVISEKYDRMSEEDKEKVLIHELMHVPFNFGGGFKHHGNYVTNAHVNKMHEEYKAKKMNKMMGFKLF